MTPQLCLGTAQFGLAYGITNTVGQVAEASLRPLLAKAQEVGICWLDTAQAYGSAEATLGRQLSPYHRFRLISKLPAQPCSEFKVHDANSWEQAFRTSCKRLGVLGLDGFLLHSASDLAKPGGHHLKDWLLSLRERGLVNRLGVSIYSEEDLQYVNPSLLDLVQLPLSLFDQRLIHNGTVSRLRAQGVAVHARSLYLQGLLLTPASQ